MLNATDPAHRRLLTLPESPSGVLSIRAKALVFHDVRSADLLEHVERIARSDASVLVIGETGTGKELIARHLHTQSGRQGPFLAVNCGAFSESLIDAELFGHEAGAFTGAHQARAGWFEAANGGTLFLDEIGDLPAALQEKLLRVLQERQVVRLGSRKPIALDVRLVAATAQTATPPAAGASTPSYVAPPWKYKIKELSYQQIDALLAQPDKLLVLDLRRPDELITYGSFPVFLNIQSRDLEKHLAYLPRDRAILTVSNHAQRAGAAGDLLVAKGYNVVGAAGSEDYEKEGGKAVTHIKPPLPRTPQ